MIKSDNKTLGIIYAGGTFGSHGKPLDSLPATIFLPILTDVLNQHCPFLTDWQILDNPIIKDSSQLSPLDFYHFYQLILHRIRQQDIRHFVLITGTDTLSYLAAFLAKFLVNCPINLVITGSMLPLLQQTMPYQVNPQSDGFKNLITACQIATQSHHGVQVCFGQQIWQADSVQKIHSHALSAFVGDDFQAKIFQPSNDWLPKKIEQLPNILAKLQNIQIDVLYLLPMSDGQLLTKITQILAKPPNALILMAFGTGNLPVSPALKSLLFQAHQQGCLLVIASQCPLGGVRQDYLAGAWLDECHLISYGQTPLPAIFADILWHISHH